MTRWLRDDELQLWRTCMHVALTVQGCIADDFKIHGITVADYSVLVPLSESPTGKCSVGQIARKGAWDAPGLARHIRRMEERGLVQRTATSEGTSGTAIELTPRAQELMSAAAPQHVERVRSILFDNLDSDDLKSLSKIMTQLSGGLPERLLGYAAEPIAAESLRGSLILSPPESERDELEAAADSETQNVASEESAQGDDTDGSGDDVETTSTDDPVGQESSDTTESPVNVSQSGDIKLSSDQDLNKSHSALTGSADIAGATASLETSGETEPLGKTPAGEPAEAETSAEDSADDVTSDDSLIEDADEDSAAERSAEQQVDLDSDASLDGELDHRDDAADEDDPADEIGTDSSAHSLTSKVRDEVEDDTPVTATSDSADNDKDDPVGESDNPKQPTADSEVDAPESVNSSTKSLFGLSARMVDNLDRLDRFGMGEPITYESSPLPKIDGITDSHRRIGQSSDESSSQEVPQASAQPSAQTEGSFEAEYEAAYENNPHPPREGQDKYQHYTYGPSPLPTISTSDHSEDSDEGSASSEGNASSEGSAPSKDSDPADHTVTAEASAPAESAKMPAEAESDSKPSSGRKLGALRIDDADSEAASDSPEIDATQTSPSSRETESDPSEVDDVDARRLSDSELPQAEDAAATEAPANTQVTKAEVADASLADTDVADTNDETDAGADIDVESSADAADVVTAPDESHEDPEQVAAEADDIAVSRDRDEAPEDSHRGSGEPASDDNSASDANRSSGDVEGQADEAQSDVTQSDANQSDDAQSSELDADEPHVSAGAVEAEDVSDAVPHPEASPDRDGGPAIVPDKRRIQGVRKLLPSPRGNSEPKAASKKAKPASPKRFVSGRRKVGGAASAETPSRTPSKEADSKVGVTSAAIPKQRDRHNHNRELCRATAPWQYPARPATNGDNQHTSSGISKVAFPDGLSESLATELWSPISPPLPPRQHSNCPLPQPSA